MLDDCSLYTASLSDTALYKLTNSFSSAFSIYSCISFETISLNDFVSYVCSSFCSDLSSANCASNSAILSNLFDSSVTSFLIFDEIESSASDSAMALVIADSSVILSTSFLALFETFGCSVYSFIPASLAISAKLNSLSSRTFGSF